MNILKAIKERRSIRDFNDNSIPKEKVKKLVEAGIWAPSGSNLQAWIINAVKGETADDIKRFSPGLMGDPPVLLVISSNKKKYLEKGGELGEKVLSHMDVAIAAQNICLAATSLEIGTCIVRSFNQIAVSEILDLDEKFNPELIVSVGKPNKMPEAPPRRDLKEAVEWQGWEDE